MEVALLAGFELVQPFTALAFNCGLGLGEYNPFTLGEELLARLRFLRSFVLNAPQLNNAIVCSQQLWLLAAAVV